MCKFERVHYGEHLCESIWIVVNGSGEVCVYSILVLMVNLFNRAELVVHFGKGYYEEH